MWESLAQGQHKPSDCSLQINIPDNSTLEAKLPKKKKKLIFHVYVSSCVVPSRQAAGRRRNQRGAALDPRHGEGGGGGFRNNPRGQFIYCCHAAKLGKYFFKFHSEELRQVEVLVRQKMENKGKKRER